MRRHVNGESGRALAEECELPSPTTVANWAVIYRRDSEDGLRPKKRGRPPVDRGDCPDEKRARDTAHGERTTSRRVRVSGKLRALRSQERRAKVRAVDDLKAQFPLALLPEDRAPPQIGVLRPSESTPLRGPAC
ncbi:helix-turn-helix domain-containing protein [Rhodococcus sp. IEGM 1366]|uniref:helix-turn-helix domain-containing protein n=1 Tax=Rhodococcus sp. IEGM 1366 TaxID=3082223 RepID=UPI00398937CE